MTGFRLGDLLAIGGALLYFLSKFLSFFTISYRGVVNISSSLNGWSGSRVIWNWLEIALVVAVLAIAIVAALDVVPALGQLRGILFVVGGVLLLVLTAIAFIDVRRVASDAGTSGGPGIGFILGLLFPLVIVGGGLLKMGVLPGDDVVALGSGGGSAPAPVAGAPFSGPPPYTGAPGGPNAPTGVPGGGYAPGSPGNYGQPGGNRTGGPMTGGQGPYGAPPQGSQGPYGSPPPGGAGMPGGSPQGPYGAPPPGGPGGYGGPPSQPR